jgi:peptide/nickel transport system substrate-binding protein
VPWPLATIDPHRLDDAAAAILGDALFDGLYSFEAHGAIVPQLAEGEPEPDPSGLKITLRDGLRTGRGRALGPRDVVYSLSRSRAMGARAWLADIPTPRLDAKGALVFATRDAARLSVALASPLASIVPNGFVPHAPDGTGPFRVRSLGDVLVLEKNPVSARGAAFLDELVVRRAPDLATSLRAFESAADDIGWLGAGLHEPRPDARPFDAGHVAWAILATGRDAADWDAPGTAQRLADEVPPERVAFLGMGAPWPAERPRGWGGPPAAILVREDSPWLVELAGTVAAILSRPGHELTSKPVPPVELEQRLAARTFALAVDVARPLGPGPLAALVAFETVDVTAQAVDVLRHPPRLGDVPVRTLTRTLRVAVLGEVRVQGARAPDVVLASSPTGFGLDFGASSRVRR